MSGMGTPSGAGAPICTACGTPFGGAESACSVCGSARPIDVAAAEVPTPADSARWAPADPPAHELTAPAHTIVGPAAPRAFTVSSPLPPQQPPAPSQFAPPSPASPPPSMPVAPAIPDQSPAPSYYPTPAAAYTPTEQTPAVHPVLAPPTYLAPLAPSAGVPPARYDGGPTDLEPHRAKGGVPVWAVITAAVVVIAILVAGIVVVASKDDGETAAKEPSGPAPVKPATLLELDEKTAIEALKPFERSSTLSQLNAATGDANRAIGEIDDLIADVDRITSPAARTATRTALTETKEVLTAFGGLKGYSGENATQWAMLSASVEDHRDALDDALDRLKDLGAYRTDGDLVDRIDNARDTVDSNVKTIEGKLADWSAEAKKVNDDKAARLAALDSYANSVRPLTTQYRGLRKDTQEFINRVDTSFVTFAEAYSFFDSATSQRQSVRTSLATLTPPASATAAHSGLVAVIDTAISAMNDAVAGLHETEASQYSYYGDYTYYKDTAGWRTFLTKSDQISGTYDNALRVWEDAITTERAQIEAITPPKKPTV